MYSIIRFYGAKEAFVRGSLFLSILTQHAFIACTNEVDFCQW